MIKSKEYSSVSGISFCNLLFLTFLVLKLTNVIDWSWWWVTAPLWLPVSIAIGFILILLGITTISAGLVNRKDRWQ